MRRNDLDGAPCTGDLGGGVRAPVAESAPSSARISASSSDSAPAAEGDEAHPTYINRNINMKMNVDIVYIYIIGYHHDNIMETFCQDGICCLQFVFSFDKFPLFFYDIPRFFAH